MTHEENKDCICQETTWHKTGLEIGYETPCKNKARFRVRHDNAFRVGGKPVDKVVCGVHVRYFIRNPWGLFDALNLVIEPID
jgi:hypothetical protein